MEGCQTIYGIAMDTLNASYTSASSLPVKLITNPRLISSAKNHRIIPWHVQLNPTNKCQLHCSFCSCKNRDTSLELSLAKAKKIVGDFVRLGTRAVTITGGGEPLMWPGISKFLTWLDEIGIESGLVTNGLGLKYHAPDVINLLSWCRISVSDEARLKLDSLSKMISDSPDVDWALSYVVTSNFNPMYFRDVLAFASMHDLSHVRVVSDILDPLVVLKQSTAADLDFSRVIFQGRKQHGQGSWRCLISLLKPNIGPDGRVYPCCGIQYAVNPPSLDYDPKDSMGNDIELIWKNQMSFDGSKCVRCYYAEYNNELNVCYDHKLLKHSNFV